MSGKEDKEKREQEPWGTMSCLVRLTSSVFWREGLPTRKDEASAMGSPRAALLCYASQKRWTQNLGCQTPTVAERILYGGGLDINSPGGARTRGRSTRVFTGRYE